MGKRKLRRGAAYKAAGQVSAMRKRATREQSAECVSSGFVSHGASKESNADAKCNQSEQQRRSKHIMRRSQSLYVTDDSILCIGDGDLSFSRSLHDKLQKECKGHRANRFRLLATVLDNERTLHKKYPLVSIRNAKYIQKQTGCRVLYGVDCRRLHEQILPKYGLFSKIVFNFPHTGSADAETAETCGKRETDDMFLKSMMQKLITRDQDIKTKTSKRIKRVESVERPENYSVVELPKTQAGHSTLEKIALKSHDEEESDPVHLVLKSDVFSSGKHPNISEHQSLLQQFFLSAATVLGRNADAEIHVTLRNGEPYRSWRVERCAKSVLCTSPAGKQFGVFRCDRVEDFRTTDFPDYMHRRTDGKAYESERGFSGENITQNAKVHIFRWTQDMLQSVFSSKEGDMAVIPQHTVDDFQQKEQRGESSSVKDLSSIKRKVKKRSSAIAGTDSLKKRRTEK